MEAVAVRKPLEAVAVSKPLEAVAGSEALEAMAGRSLWMNVLLPFSPRGSIQAKDKTTS